jgi:Rrf2 family protein
LKEANEMKLLTKNTDYAVRALMQLATEPGRYLSATEIANREKIPAQFLKRLLQTLIRGKLLSSKEGVGGGVQLAKKPSAIRVIDVITLFQGEFQISACMFRKKVCPNRATCVLRRRVKAIEDRLVAEFEGITIQKLLEDLQ